MQKHYRLLGILFLFLQTPLASSQSGGVAWFDAPSESYVDIGSTNNSNCFSDLQNGDVLTVTMWVKWDDKSASNVGNWANCLTYADSVGNADNGTFWCQHNNQNSRFEFQLQTGNGQPQSILSSTDPQEGNWYHVAHVYDGTFMMIYVNGNLENYAFESGNLNVSSNSKLNMGRMPNSSNNHRYFDGAMDEVSVWKRALTQQEIQTLMNNPESLLGLNYDANGLIGYWDFNDFEVDDKSPCDNDGGGSSSFTTVPMGAEVTRTTASGDCNDPGNWNNGVPDDSTTAIVEDSVYMTQRTTTKHLVLKDSLNSMGDTLTIEGDMIQKGNFIPSGGVLEFDCSSTSTRKIVAKQPFKANEMLVDVPSKVELDTGSLHIRETLKMVSGTLDVGKKELTLLSDSNGTARIAALPSNAAIQGQIAVQRWIPSGNAGWIDMAAPNRDSVIVDEWDDDIYISGKTTGGFDDGCSWSSGCFWSVKRSNSNGELVDVTSAFTSLENGRGYELFIGDDGGVNVMNSDTTVTVKGRIKQSNSFSVNVNDNQWSLVANPFASPIDFDAIGLNNVDPYYYVAAATGSYEWYDRSSNSSSHPEVGPIITSSQGFWVKGNGSNASITFQQSHKTGAAASFAKDNGGEAFELTLTDASNGLSSSIMLHEGDPNAFSEV
ncbi:MAG: LamG domain-containing protein, partial [Flavobacteriales bacterium]